MTRTTRTSWIAVLIALGLAAGGCMAGMSKLGEGLGIQFKKKGEEIEQALVKIGQAMAASGGQPQETFTKLKDTLVAKYERHHKPARVVFFTEDAEPPEAKARPEAPGEPKPTEMVPAKEIQSAFLSEQILERRGLRLIWKLPLDGTGIRYADVNGDHLYVVTKKNRMYCIESATGLVQWISDLHRRPDGPPGFSPRYAVISAGDVVRIIDKRAGQVKWQFETNIHPVSRPYCTSSHFVYGCLTGDVCGFQFGDRFPRWRFKASAAVYAAPCYLEGFAFAVDDGGSLVKYNVALRLTSKETPLGARPVGDLLAFKQMLYLGTENSEMVAVRAPTASKIWTHGSGGRVAAGPWLSKTAHVLYYGARDDGLYALTAATGKRRWMLPGGLKPVGVSGDDLFVLKADGALCRVNAGTGKPLWSEPTAPFVTAIDQTANDAVYLISEDGQIFAVAPKK